MGGWRRQKGDSHFQYATKTKSHNKKPTSERWQPTVPSWERKFCRSVCLMRWEEILEAKRFIHLFENIVRWNDSAGEEAFRNAKNRFYAKIHGLPCDILLPDPDIYIDKVDWEAKIDPELLVDLERGPAFIDSGRKDENVVIFGDSLLSNQGFTGAGWGESEEELDQAKNSALNNNPCDHRYSQKNEASLANGWGHFHNNPNGWDEGNVAVHTNGWKYRRNKRFGGWQQYDKNNTHNMYTHGGVTGNDENRRRDQMARFMSRYNTPNLHGDDDHQRYNGSGNGKARKNGNFVWGSPCSRHLS